MEVLLPSISTRNRHREPKTVNLDENSRRTIEKSSISTGNRC